MVMGTGSILSVIPWRRVQETFVPQMCENLAFCLFNIIPTQKALRGAALRYVLLLVRSVLDFTFTHSSLRHGRGAITF